MLDTHDHITRSHHMYAMRFESCSTSPFVAFKYDMHSVCGHVTEPRNIIMFVNDGCDIHISITHTTP